MALATVVFGGSKGFGDGFGWPLRGVRVMRVWRRANSRHASPWGRAPALEAAGRGLVFGGACGSGRVEGAPQIEIGEFEFDLVRAA